MVIGLQIGKLHRGQNLPPLGLPDSEKPGLNAVSSVRELAVNWSLAEKVIQCTTLNGKKTIMIAK